MTKKRSYLEFVWVLVPVWIVIIVNVANNTELMAFADVETVNLTIWTLLLMPIAILSFAMFFRMGTRNFMIDNRSRKSISWTSRAAFAALATGAIIVVSGFLFIGLSFNLHF